MDSSVIRRARVIPFFWIPERSFSLLFPFSQAWEKGLGDEGGGFAICLTVLDPRILKEVEDLDCRSLELLIVNG
jgi:hypothetical protein